MRHFKQVNKEHIKINMNEQSIQVKYANIRNNRFCTGIEMKL